MLAPVRSVAPTVPLLTLDEAKTHCRIDSSDEDDLVQTLIDAATAHIDGYSGILGRALVTQTWRQDFSCFDQRLRLPVGDLIAVTSVTYYDGSNVQQTLSTSVYAALADVEGPYLTLKSGQSWPSVYSRDDAIRVTWTAGYGATAALVPAAIRAAVKLLIGHWYANRETVVAGDRAAALEIPMTADALLGPFRQVGT